MNTELHYLYRDAGNYKFRNCEVINGVLELRQIQAYLWEGTFFIPSEVGLTDLQPDPLTAEDHIWHEIEALEPTNEAPTLTVDSLSLIGSFQLAATGDWNQASVFKRKG